MGGGGAVSERTIDVDGVEVFCRELGGEGTPTVFVHGNPTHSEDWLPFLERMRGPAIALDLPGFGRSGRPRDFDYTMHGYAGFLERFLDATGLQDYKLVVHDWGALGLIPAQRHPIRVRLLVVINSVPLLEGYRWHWVARLWRRRVVGELVNATSTRRGIEVTLRQATTRGRMPDEFVDMVWRHLDAGTKRAVLKLYRSADPPVLAAAGRGLSELKAPALVVWGERDPYLPAAFGRLYAEALPGAQLWGVPDAGHWPWIDRPEVVDRVVAFLND